MDGTISSYAKLLSKDSDIKRIKLLTVCWKGFRNCSMIIYNFLSINVTELLPLQIFSQ